MTNNDDTGKLFIGGLSWETSKEVLQEYFSQFGTVVDSVVMVNNQTGRSRGFGFVTFEDAACVTTVLQSRPHEINGRIVDAKECTPRSMQKNRKGVLPGKVFLGGLPSDITETDIRNALSRFGTVTQVSIMCDPETKKSRGFGFLSFESEDSIDQACSQRFVTVNGKQVECKRAEPRENRRNEMNGGQRLQQPPYGSGPGYQVGWNQPPPSQAYPVQTQAYAGYASYNSMNGSSYSGGNVPYGDPSAYQQPTYSTYGAGGYAYTQPPAAAVFPPQPAAYVQSSTPAYPPAAGEGDSAVGTDNSYGYGQNTASYGPDKTHGNSYMKGVMDNGAAGVNRGQAAYHPYRR